MRLTAKPFMYEANVQESRIEALNMSVDPNAVQCSQRLERSHVMSD